MFNPADCRDELDSCTCGINFTCDACLADARLAELQAVGLAPFAWEGEEEGQGQDAPTIDDVPLEEGDEGPGCESCGCFADGEVLGIACCGRPGCVAKIEREVAADMDEAWGRVEDWPGLAAHDSSASGKWLEEVAV